MNSRRWGLLFILLALFALALPVGAQGASSKAAFLNASGQLIVSSGDGSYRWIVTNPGEALADPIGFSWAPGGSRLFFALNQGGEVSLRSADINSQSVAEIGRLPNNALSGGQWTPDGGGVLVAAGDRIVLAQANGAGLIDVLTGQGAVRLITPYADDRPNLPRARSLSPDGRYLFYQGGDGRYTVRALDGSTSFALPAGNDAGAPQVGLWSDAAPLVAHWGYEGNSVIVVTHAPSGQSVTLDSGRAAPVNPLAWRPGTTQLIYRDATGFIRAADLGCLASGCGANPLANGVELAPASAADVQTDGTWVYFRDGDVIRAVNLGCVGAGNCAASAVTLGANAAPQTMLHVAARTLAYTAYAQDPNNLNDREVRIVNLNCLNDPASCAAQTFLGGAVAGLLSPDGGALIVEQAGSGMNILNLGTLASTYLSDLPGGSPGSPLLMAARWG